MGKNKYKKSLSEISIRTGASVNTVYSIAYLNKWSSISSDYDIKSYNVRQVSEYTPEEKVIKICELIMEHKLSNIEIAEVCGVKPYTVSDIKQKKVFKSITEKYNFPIKRIKRNKNIDKIKRSTTIETIA